MTDESAMSRVDLRYDTANQLLIEALPEFRSCYERYEKDWDHYKDSEPGPFVVFNDILALAIGILITLPAETECRDELLRRYFAFLEHLLSSDDGVLRFLAVDVLRGSVRAHPDGPSAVGLGGIELERWFASEDWEHVRRVHEEQDPWEYLDFVDFWGVREALADLLPEIDVADIPGRTARREN